MSNPYPDPGSREEPEHRSQQLRARHARARLLFHCYAPASDTWQEQDEEDGEDAYYPYYAGEHGH